MSDRDRPGRGRRPLDSDDPSVSVSFKLPSRQFDELTQLAHDERVSVAELVRRTLETARQNAKKNS